VSRSEARQLVRHKGITLNGHKLNIPSAQVKPSDVIEVNQPARKQMRVQAALELAQQRGFADWVDVDVKKMAGTFKAIPDRSDLPAEINEQLVVELYSK
jgi:small subunit ribosomal protein S4